jgi:AsmA protein
LPLGEFKLFAGATVQHPDKTKKIFYFAICGFLALLFLVAVALFLLVDPNTYKAQLATVASKALGLEVRVGGRLGIGFFPGLHCNLVDLHISNRGVDLVSAKEARLGIDLLPLFQKKVRIGKIALKHARISIERDHDGKFNFENPVVAGETLPALNMAEFSFSDGTFLYADQESGKEFTARDCRLTLQSLAFAGGKGSDLMKNLSLTGELACGEVRAIDLLTGSDLKVSISGKNGVFALSPVAMRIFGGQGSGSIRAEFGGVAPLYHIDYALAQFRLEEFFKTLGADEVAEGAMDFSANLSLQAKTGGEQTLLADGMISLRGKDLTLLTVDLDQKLSRFESSQNFNLVDVGALLFTGPVGLLITKGYDFAGGLRGSGGHSKIRRLVSNWKIERGVARAQDVAMATDKNRLALQGGLDFVNRSFDNMSVAVIDAGGCATVQQKVHGSFQKPLLEKPGIIKSLTGPALNLLKEGVDLLPGGECEVFYAGSVPPVE